MAQTSQAGRAKLAAFLGTTMEWYDFNIYGTASALVFGKLFFPELAPGAGILASFATLGAGYIARPLGALIFGHVGDRVGRKRGLVVTMLMMGVSTVGVGVLPTYQTIGMLAPILLVALRLLQGIAVGGEWGGAVLMSAEHAGKNHRFSASAWVQHGSPAGNILATVVFLLVALLPTPAFETWGWRMPFLGSVILVAVGLLVRARLEESPEFLEVAQKSTAPRAPIIVVVRKYPLLVLLAACCGAAVNTGYGFANVFALNWGTTAVGLNRSAMLTALLIMSVVQFCIQPIAPTLGRRWSPVRVFVAASIVSAVTIPLGYVMVATGQIVPATLGLCLQIVPQGIGYVLLAGFLVEVFPAEVRYTAISLSYNLTSVAFTSTVPLIAAAILTATGSIWSVSGFQVFYVLVGLVAAVVVSRWTGAGRYEATKNRATALTGS